MCVVSMVMDQGIRDLTPWYQKFPLPSSQTTDQKLDRIISLLEQLLVKAAEYDRASGQPDCEHAEKKRTLQDIAERLGVEIQFPS